MLTRLRTVAVRAAVSVTSTGHALVRCRRLCVTAALAALTLNHAVAAQVVTTQNADSNKAAKARTTGWENVDPRSTTPVSFSFSGAISLGAYQAGVNWAMLEFIKRTHYDSAYRIRHLLPTINLGVMTGASAGDINVLLGSVEYCDLTRSKPPRYSLFWKMWVHTGFDQLSPQPDQRDAKSGDLGVLDRGAIRYQVRDAIEAAMTKRDLVRSLGSSKMVPRSFQSGCDVPLGVVVTRVSAGTIPYGRNIVVPNQRYAAMFNVQEASGRLQFVPGHPRTRCDASLGARLVLPVEPTGVIAGARVFGLVEASAAYPVAFAPKVLEYSDPKCEQAGASTPSREVRIDTDLHRESFLDGGVFDNYPVGLAVGMRRNLTSNLDRRPLVIYVDPGILRGDLQHDRGIETAAATETRATGINELVKFGLSFIPSARQGELQSFIRADERDPEFGAFLQTSTRAHHVVGEHLNAFAAFLGRPFREFDFYTGVSDGFQFVASQILCDPARINSGSESAVHARDNSRGLALPTRDAPNDGALGACTRQQLFDLAHDGFGLDSVGRVVVATVLRREYPDYQPVFVADTEPLDVSHHVVSGDRARVLSAIEDATFKASQDHRPTECPSGDLAGTFLCADGFDRIIQPLGQDKFVMGRIKDWSADKISCNVANLELYDPAFCLAEASFYDLLKNPHGTMQQTVDRALRQLRTAEEKPAGSTETSYRTAVKTIETFYRSTDQHSRRGLDLDPSSISPKDGLWRLLHFAPYYGGGFVGTTGGLLGWQPEYHVAPCLVRICYVTLSLPAEWNHLPLGYNRDAGAGNFVATSPSIGRTFARPWLNQIDVGARLQFKSDNELWNRWPAPMPQFTATLLLGKVRLGVYRLDSKLSVDGRVRPIVTVSMADVNGVVYWLFR